MNSILLLFIFNISFFSLSFTPTKNPMPHLFLESHQNKSLFLHKDKWWTDSLIIIYIYSNRYKCLHRNKIKEYVILF